MFYGPEFQGPEVDGAMAMVCEPTSPTVVIMLGLGWFEKAPGRQDR